MDRDLETNAGREARGESVQDVPDLRPARDRAPAHLDPDAAPENRGSLAASRSAIVSQAFRYSMRGVHQGDAVLLLEVLERLSVPAVELEKRTERGFKSRTPHDGLKVRRELVPDILVAPLAGRQELASRQGTTASPIFLYTSAAMPGTQYFRPLRSCTFLRAC